MDSEFQQAMGDGEDQGTGRTGKPGVLQSMGSQRVGYDTATEQQQQRNLTTKCNTWIVYWKNYWKRKFLIGKKLSLHR